MHCGPAIWTVTRRCAPRRGRSKSYAGRSGLGIGLRDLYWITVFGSPFTKIIKHDRLLRCPAFEVESLAPDMIYMRVTEAFIDPRQPSVRGTYQAVRDCIGERFFAKTQLEARPKPPASGSLLNPLRLFQLKEFLSGAGRHFDDESIKADVCPSFDWSNILIRAPGERP